MTKYTLNVNIDQYMVRTLTKASYKLCVGVETEGDCPVVSSATGSIATHAE